MLWNQKELSNCKVHSEQTFLNLNPKHFFHTSWLTYGSSIGKAIALSITFSMIKIQSRPTYILFVLLKQHLLAIKKKGNSSLSIACLFKVTKEIQKLCMIIQLNCGLNGKLTKIVKYTNLTCRWLSIRKFEYNYRVIKLKCRQRLLTIMLKDWKQFLKDDSLIGFLIHCQKFRIGMISIFG